MPNRNESQSGERDDVHRQLCERVRELRKQRQWTLEKLASICGVSRSMLSQIERGTANPTLAVAFRIAQAFEIGLSELVDIDRPDPEIEVIRASDEQYLFRDDEQCRIRTLSPLNLEKDVEFYEVTLRQGAVLDSAPHFTGTREFVTVEKGSIRLTSQNESCDLHRGDSAHYPADVHHRLENIGRGDAIAFLVDIYQRTS